MMWNSRRLMLLTMAAVVMIWAIAPVVAAGGEPERQPERQPEREPTVAVSAIKAPPGRYVGQVVQARGTVTQASKTPFVDVGVYLLRHDEGSMMVLGTGAPETDSERTVRVHVVGISTGATGETAESLTSVVSRFLVANNIATESNAQRVSQVVVRFMSAFGEWVEGCAFLIEAPTNP